MLNCERTEDRKADNRDRRPKAELFVGGGGAFWA